jgi:hypothetical protein
MLSLVTIRYLGKCAVCKEEFYLGETALKFPWKGKRVIACDLCTEQCLLTLHPNYEPPSKSSPDA